MPNSLRTKFNSMRHKGRIDEAEYQALIKKLDGHDSELLNKVAEKLKANIEKYWYRSELDMSADNVNCLIDEVIEEMKAEVSK